MSLVIFLALLAVFNIVDQGCPEQVPPPPPRNQALLPHIKPSAMAMGMRRGEAQRGEGIGRLQKRDGT